MRFTKLDGLRGFFSLMIVFYHYDKEFLPKFFDNFLINNSYVFVDFFFVLSGFVISYNYNSLDTLKKFISFTKKRIIRLYPLHLYTTIVYFVYILFSRLILINIFPEYFQDSSFTYKKHIEPFFDGIILTNSTPILGTSSGTNGPSWSISSEMISYLTFGLITFLASKRVKEFYFLLIIFFSSLLCYHYGNFFVGGEYGFLRGFVGFFSGCFVWKAYSRNKTLKINNNIEFLIPILLVLIIFLIDYFDQTKIGLILGIFTIPSFFSISIFILLYSNGFLSKILKTQFFQYLGKISFSIYLNHYLLLILFLKPIYRIIGLEQTLINQNLIMVLAIILVIFYSHITYSLIEKRFGNFLRRRLL